MMFETARNNDYSHEISSIEEALYVSSHPDVISWTDLFHTRMNKKGIFKNTLQPSSRECARVVGVSWYQFSSFMPWFLCQAAAKVSTNEKRHYVIQTAFEELGMRRVDQIHPEIFRSTVRHCGVSDHDFSRIVNVNRIEAVLDHLRARLLSYRSDSSTLGVLLGLEIPAVENIETIYTALAYTESLKRFLDRSPFFVMHRQIEIEHVRLTVSNFLRFCPDENSRALFIKGFDDGLHFWKVFWKTVARAVRKEMRAAGR